ncbi:MAG TPA: cysteine biosynthesis protein CysZ [bacterium]|nr:cysteine biosynthesis protein CysZ [bacterium]
MLRAFALALAQMFSGPVLTVLCTCTILGIAVFVGLWFGIDYGIDTYWPSARNLPGVSLLGGLLTLVLAWFLLPVVVTLFVTGFLEHVAKTVERRHYPDLPDPEGLSLLRAIGASLRFFVVMVAANLLLLVLLLFPPVYAVAWFVVNGWLFGREYFELVALRREQPSDADLLRRRNRLACLLTGTALAALALVPLFNLVLPVFATAVMVHRYHDWRGHYSGGG